MKPSGHTGVASDPSALPAAGAGNTLGAAVTAAAAVAALTDCIAPELRAVDRVFAEELASDLPCVNVLVKHVSRFRGKMLRPLLLLLAGKACGELADAHVT